MDSNSNTFAATEVMEWVGKLGVSGIAMWMLHWARGVIEQMMSDDRKSREDMKAKLFDFIASHTATTTSGAHTAKRVDELEDTVQKLSERLIRMEEKGKSGSH